MARVDVNVEKWKSNGKQKENGNGHSNGGNGFAKMRPFKSADMANGNGNGHSVLSELNLSNPDVKVIKGWEPDKQAKLLTECRQSDNPTAREFGRQIEKIIKHAESVKYLKSDGRVSKNQEPRFYRPGRG